MPWSSLWNSARRIRPDAPVRFLRFEGITFAHNHLHNLGHALLSDIGGIYTLGVSLGTRLVGNVIHDIKARAYGGWGIYPDEGSSQIVIASNLVYRCSSAPYFSHINRKITVQNNIFALGEQCQVERAGAMSGPEFEYSFQRNIVYYRKGQLVGYCQTSNDLSYPEKG